VQTQASTTLTRGGQAFRQGVAPVFAPTLALILVLLPLVVLPPLASASASSHHTFRHNDAWARQHFAKADRMREALNGRPLAERTRHEYQRVIDAYRSVYFGSPASSKADPSVVATAELMVEMGRRFDDNKILRGAIEQYRFLRKEYPGSRYRFDALFTIGEIYKDDLNDPAEAKATFTDFVSRYPRNRLADDARAAVKDIEAEAAKQQQSPRKLARKQRPNAATSANSGADDSTESATAASARRNVLPRVTGVRHWSTPDYTRVAIDIEKEVKFGSQRISDPDRIFFDLRDTTLASTLVGKTFDVDDGFLKKIRVAESQPGRTRIVLEVDDLARYDAFLLPDPYRLIIDIHGKQKRGTLAKPNSAAATLPESGDDSDGAAASRKAGLVETDLPPEASDDSTASTAAKPADERASERTNDHGVIKTTVGVKGSQRRIPKTIVTADDKTGNDSEKTASETASLKHEKFSTKAIVRDSSASSPSSSSSSSSTSIQRKKTRSSAADTADLSAETREARPTASGDRSLTRALGLKIGKIVIDAGHGGHDTGTIGPNGLLEKDVVLDVAKRLGRLLETRLGAEVVYTRRDDTFIPLETRTAIANRERADLFISIHANSSRDSDARGVETYYLNFTSSPEALEVAARENAVSEKSIHELQDLVKKIALKEKIEESREFAGDVQESLYGGLALNSSGIRNRGIKKAPFIVLIGANMPSILAEISFVSNPTDERKMETSEHRQRIAESLYRGVSKYVNGLSGVKVASKIDKSEGQ
jgi:N-acetylmuramoyl-L-alanine amidase